MNKVAFNKRLKIRREVLGARYVDAAIKNADHSTQSSTRIKTECAWRHQ